MTFKIIYSAFDHCDVRLQYSYVDKMTVIILVMCTLTQVKL